MDQALRPRMMRNIAEQMHARLKSMTGSAKAD
jgi:hypothetical protein